ncbi:30S ribosomal protein S9 [Candidatus Babeliales bacterium]|nr:30S ribosomal protein S9 [Candidatus Babeliales bacterium]MCF7899477.1 30S ribosomal protein S9 [Candidatus Babeliales bacterium]
MKKTTNISDISNTSINNHGVGRRKSAVARVWLKRGNGSIIVNGRDYNKYFDTKVTKDTVVSPCKISGLAKDFDIQVNVHGGGLVGQAGAVKLGISRALVNYDETLKSAFKKYDFLTVDSRVKERKKYGRKAARRRFQFVKR